MVALYSLFTRWWPRSIQHVININTQYIHRLALHVSFMPLDAFEQSCGNKQSQNLDPQHNNCDRSYQALVLLDPARDSPETAAQEDHALSGKLIQLLGSDATLRVPHRAVLQRVHAARRGDAAGQHPWRRAVVISGERETFRSSKHSCILTN